MMTAELAYPEAMGETILDTNRLITMANQIGDFFAPYPRARRAEGIRNHLRTYWDPRMREGLLAHIERGAEGLHPHVIEGARLLLQTDRATRGYYGPPKA
jgi:formate dehydrogenase subunit delta